MPLPQIKSREELETLVEKIGFLPLFDGTVPGFSARAATPDGPWFSGEEDDPWRWRMEIADRGRLVYGKFLEHKAAFFSREAFALLAGWRRDGYDFDTLYEEGRVSRRQKKLMDALEEGQVLPGYRLRAMAGFGKEGERGFEGALTALQMSTYVTVRRLGRKVNKKGEEYGWPVNFYIRAEDILGADFALPYYTVPPARCLESLVGRLRAALPEVGEEEARRFFK